MLLLEDLKSEELLHGLCEELLREELLICDELLQGFDELLREELLRSEELLKGECEELLRSEELLQG